MMNRREALKSKLIIAGALSTVSLSTLISSCKTDTKDAWIAEFCTADEIKILEVLTEQIIPKTDTPGANDAMVHRFIDSAVNDVLESDEQKIIRDGLSSIEAMAKSAHSKSYVDIDANQRDAILQAKVDEAVKGDAEQYFFPLIKQLTLAGFFTSEIGSTQVLTHNPIPGEFLGCVPFGENDVMMAQVGGAY